MNKKRMYVSIPTAHLTQLQAKFKTDLNILQISKEECAELAQAISKVIRVAQGTARDINMKQAKKLIVKELTDVIICAMALCEIFGISQREINEGVLSKAKRDGFDMSNYDD